jgi:hypothetical protein
LRSRGHQLKQNLFLASEHLTFNTGFGPYSLRLTQNPHSSFLNYLSYSLWNHMASKLPSMISLAHMEVELHTLLFIGIANKIFKELLLLYTYFIILSTVFKIKFLIQFRHSLAYLHQLNDY